MAVAAGLLGTTAGGAFAGGVARGRDEQRMAQQIESDLWYLGAERRLPETAPIFPLKPRRQRHGFLCYLVGILGTGFVAWLLTVIVTAALIAGWDSPDMDMDPSQQFTTPLFAGFVVGTFAFVPGLVVGALIWLREVRGRIREATAEPYRVYWAERDRGAQALAHRQATPHQVAQVLALYVPETVPLDDE